MDNSLHNLGNDLQEILGDLEPATTITPPPSAPETPESSPATTVPIEKVIQQVRDIQRLSQELLTWLHTVETPLIPVVSRAYSPAITPDTTALEPNAGLGKTLEGYFSGEKMIGDDGNDYNVPPNYASKSKLVTGDRMKLIITPHGAFIYKQIGPIERKRVIGSLNFNVEHNRWTVQCPEAIYRVLPASISFYKGKPGDEVILFVPEHTPAEWGAVDQLIAK